MQKQFEFAERYGRHLKTNPGGMLIPSLWLPYKFNTHS